MHVYFDTGHAVLERCQHLLSQTLAWQQLVPDGLTVLKHEKHVNTLKVFPGSPYTPWRTPRPTPRHTLAHPGAHRHVDTFQCCSGASAGNRTRVTLMATMYSATRPLMLLHNESGAAYSATVCAQLVSATLQGDQACAAGQRQSWPFQIAVCCDAPPPPPSGAVRQWAPAYMGSRG